MTIGPFGFPLSVSPLGPRRNARGRGFCSSGTKDLIAAFDQNAREKNVSPDVAPGAGTYKALSHIRRYPLPVLRQPVAKEKLEGAVEPDMWRREELAVLGAYGGGRAEADKTVVNVGRFERPCLVTEHGFGIVRQLAGIDSRLRVSVEDLAVDMLSFEGRTDDGFERGAVGAADLGLACRPHRGKRDDIDLGANRLDPRDGLAGQVPQDRFEPVMVGVMQVIGLGRGKKDFVDLGLEQSGQKIAAAGPERGQD